MTTFCPYNCLNSPWHTFYEVLTCFWWNVIPLLTNPVPQFMHPFRWSFILIKLVFEVLPKVFNWIEVRRLGWLGYCYELLFFSDTCLPCFFFHFSFMIRQMFTTRQTCLLHMHTSFLHYNLHVFASWLTHFSYLFKPVVRRLYSLAFH